MSSDLESKTSTNTPSSNIALHSHICNYKSKLLKQIPVSKIELSYHPEVPPEKRLKILDSRQAADILRSLWDKNTLELHEQFCVLYLNNRNQIIGFYPHTSGAITHAIIDIRLILATALGCGAVAMIIAHNHPSSNTKPSKTDGELTEKIKEAAKVMDIKLLDHIILTKQDHYSFADEGDLSF